MRGQEPVAEIELVLYETNHPGPRLRAQITVLQAHPADFDQSFTPSLRSMTRGEDRHPISVVCSGPSATAYPKLVNVESDGKSAPCCVAPMTWAVHVAELDDRRRPDLLRAD